MHRAAADQRTSAGARAQFGQRHPHRHIVTLSLPALQVCRIAFAAANTATD
jgi:hypothetical protein